MPNADGPYNEPLKEDAPELNRLVFVVSGCGKAELNGTYYEDSSAQQLPGRCGRPWPSKYQQDGGDWTIEYRSSTGRWYLSDTTARNYYYCESDSPCTPGDASWQVYIPYGTAPPPSISSRKKAQNESM